MNCLDFRDALLVDPRRHDREFLAHQAACAECAREAESALDFEAKLFAAMDVEPPRGLDARILHRQPGGRRPQRWTMPRARAVAASVVLAAGLASWMGASRWLGEPSRLDVVVLDHINHELDHLAARHDLGTQRVATVLARLGGGVSGDIGEVWFADVCAIRKALGAHLVLAGRTGPVTVLVMPGERLSHRLIVVAPGFNGVVLPTSYGSLAVVGRPGETLEDRVATLQRRLVWNI